MRFEAEQRRLDQRLRDQQFYTRSLIESNIDALITTDPQGIISDVNKQMEALTGCTRDELIGAPFKNYFTDPDLAEAGIKRVLAENKVTNYELTARARDGTQTVVSYNATTLYDRNRTLQGVFAAARDITERRVLDQALMDTNDALRAAKAVADKANLAKSDFLSSMSHELRSPLNAILGFAQLLESSTPPPTASQRQSIGQILQAGWYLLELINEILDLALIESGKLSLSPEPVALAEVLRDCRNDRAHGRKNRHSADFFETGGRPARSSRPDPGQTGAHQSSDECHQIQSRQWHRGGRLGPPGAEPYANQHIGHRPRSVGREAGAAVPTFQSARSGGGWGGGHRDRLGRQQAIGGIDGRHHRRDQHRRLGSIFWIELQSSTAMHLVAAPRLVAVATDGPPDEGSGSHSVVCRGQSGKPEIGGRTGRAAHGYPSSGGGQRHERDRHCTRRQPDAILMDINLPGISGLVRAQDADGGPDRPYNDQHDHHQLGGVTIQLAACWYFYCRLGSRFR